MSKKFLLFFYMPFLCCLTRREITTFNLEQPKRLPWTDIANQSHSDDTPLCLNADNVSAVTCSGYAYLQNINIKCCETEKITPLSLPKRILSYIAGYKNPERAVQSVDGKVTITSETYKDKSIVGIYRNSEAKYYYPNIQLNSLDLASNCKLIVASGKNIDADCTATCGEIHFIDANSGKENQISWKTNSLQSLIVNNDKAIAILSLVSEQSSQYEIKILSIKEQDLLRRLDISPAGSMAKSADGNILAIGQPDHSIIVCDFRTGVTVSRYALPTLTNISQYNMPMTTPLPKQLSISNNNIIAILQENGNLLFLINGQLRKLGAIGNIETIAISTNGNNLLATQNNSEDESNTIVNLNLHFDEIDAVSSSQPSTSSAAAATIQQ